MGGMIYWKQTKGCEYVRYIQRGIRIVHIEMRNYRNEGGEKIGT